MVTTDPKKSRTKLYFVSGALLLCMIISVVLQSRAFVIGYALSLICHRYTSRKFKIKPFELSGIVGGFILLIYMLSCFIKTGSTEGRLLIYKISFNILKDNWLTGIGWGNFRLQYLYYQAAYFKSGHYTTKELLLAGNTYFAFNDYFQFVIETGIAGLFIVLLICCLIWRMIKMCHNQSGVNVILSVAVMQVVAIATAALFNHVLERMIFEILLLLCFNVIFWFYAGKNRFKAASLLLVNLAFVYLITIYQFYFQVLHYRAFQNYRDAIDLNNAGYTTQAILNLQNNYVDLKNCAPYLEYYSKLLLDSNPKKADLLLKQLSKVSISSQIFLKIALCKASLDQRDSAIQNFELAINMVPNRLESRLALLNYYIKIGSDAQARKTGYTIISLPVKIPSERATAIKAEVSGFIK